MTHVHSFNNLCLLWITFWDLEKAKWCLINLQVLLIHNYTRLWSSLGKRSPQSWAHRSHRGRLCRAWWGRRRTSGSNKERAGWRFRGGAASGNTIYVTAQYLNRWGKRIRWGRDGVFDFCLEGEETYSAAFLFLMDNLCTLSITSDWILDHWIIWSSKGVTFEVFLQILTKSQIKWPTFTKLFMMICKRHKSSPHFLDLYIVVLVHY